MVTSETGNRPTRSKVQTPACPAVAARKRGRGWLVGPLVSTLLVLAGCSADDGVAWCSDASDLVETVNRNRDLVELPSSEQLRADITRAVELSGGVVSGAEADYTGAFLTLEDGIGGLDDTLAKYGYDLLRAQSESDTVEQELLYALDASVMDAALANAQNHIDDRCSLPDQ